MAKKASWAAVPLVALAVASIVGCASGRAADAKWAIGIIGAMDVEGESLKSVAGVSKVTEIAGMEFCEGALG